MSVSVGLFRDTLDSSVCAKIAAHETLLQEGVIKLGEGFVGSGIRISLDDSYRIVVRVTLIARFGADVAVMAKDIQEAVYRGLRQASSLQVAAIHVRIAGVKVEKLT